MNEPTVPLFVPPRTTPPATRGTNTLPLPRPITPPTPTPTEMIVSIARIDHSGRVPAIDQITALGWNTGDHTNTSHTGSAITVRHIPKDTPATATVDSRSQILIPSTERAHFRIHTADKLILIATLCVKIK